MKLHLRIDDQNLVHTRFTVFANGANSGALVLRNDEFADLLYWLRQGKRGNSFDVTSAAPYDELTKHP